MATGKVWFITGSSGGFGRIWAEAALKRGDRVVATARGAGTLDALAATYGDGVLTLPLDVTDRDAVFAAVGQGRERFGRLAVILNAAGHAYMGAAEELAPEDVRANFESNVFGTLWVVQAALPILRAQSGGHILTVSSLGGLLGFATAGSYVATKFAVEGLSEALAGEVEPFGVKVTIVEPGSFATGFRSSTRSAPPIAAYNPVREALSAAFSAEDRGDPAATADAILRIVDAETPPLRLALGSTVVPRVQATYETRLKTWAEWQAVSDAAQGRHLV